MSEEYSAQEQELLNDQPKESETEQASAPEDVQPEGEQAAQQETETKFDSETLRQENEQLKNLLQEIVLSANTQPQEKQAQPPELEKDPLGYVAHMAQELNDLKQAQLQAETWQKQQQVQNALGQALEQSVTRYQEKQPDFSEAFKFLYNKEIAKMQALAELDPRFKDTHFIHNMLEQNLLQITAQAMQQKQDVAALLYKLAKVEGYSQSAASSNTTDIVAASKSLAGGRGTVAGAMLTAEDFARMSEKELNKLLATQEGQDLFERALQN